MDIGQYLKLSNSRIYEKLAFDRFISFFKIKKWLICKEFNKILPWTTTGGRAKLGIKITMNRGGGFNSFLLLFIDVRCC